jgi:diguanylate cyclase (GGDEF)-like protein
MPLIRPSFLRSLRGQLALWFGGLSLLTLVSVGLYVGRLATQQVAATAGASVHATARAAADLLGASLREHELDLVLLSLAPHFTRGDLAQPAVLHSLEQRRNLREEYAWMGVTDPQGTVVQAVDGILQGQSVAQRPWFIEGQAGLYVGDVHKALLLEKLLPQQASSEPLRFIDIAAPIRNPQGALVGVVGAHIHWRWVTQTVQAAFDQHPRNQGTEILIANALGDVLYPQALASHTRLAAALPSAPTTGYARLRWDDGQEYLTSQASVQTRISQGLGWHIVVRQPLELALEPAHALRTRLLTLGLLAALAFSLVALWLARSFSRPIEQLANAARQIEQGASNARFPTDHRLIEVQQLSQSIQSMTTALLAHERELAAVNQTLETQVQQRTEALETANLELERLATRDPLTGVHNRRHFDARLLECFQTSQRTGTGFAVLLLDADHFKQVNDTHGHPAGDAVLQQLAHLLNENTRAVDFVARYGGEEFAVLLPHTPGGEGSMAAAEKIRAAIAAADFPEIGHMTVSIGASVWNPADTHAHAIVERADKALYQAKGAGRNLAMAS